MKKLALLLSAGLLLGAAPVAFADDGALGFGVISDSSETGLVGGGIRGAVFLDIGYDLFGPLKYGFEFQFDGKKMDENKSSFSKTDATVFQLSQSEWVTFTTQTFWDFTVTRWDLDFSPRGYVSLDLGGSLQLLGFAGLNYNWNSIDYTIKNTNASPQYYGDVQYDAGEENTTTNNLPGVWDVIAGARVTVGSFYLEYLRFLKPQASGDYSWNNSSKNRLGLGINLLF